MLFKVAFFRCLPACPHLALSATFLPHLVSPPHNTDAIHYHQFRISSTNDISTSITTIFPCFLFKGSFKNSSTFIGEIVRADIAISRFRGLLAKPYISRIPLRYCIFRRRQTIITPIWFRIFTRPIIEILFRLPSCLLTQYSINIQSRHVNHLQTFQRLQSFF